MRIVNPADHDGFALKGPLGALRLLRLRERRTFHEREPAIKG